MFTSSRKKRKSRSLQDATALHRYGGFTPHEGIAKHYWIATVVVGALIVALATWVIRRRRGGGIVEPAVQSDRAKP